MTGSPTVLVLSQDEVLRDLIEEMLGCEHFAVTSAGDLAQAAALCAQHRPGAILLDAVEDSSLAAALLDDPWSLLGDHQPALVLLASSATDEVVRHHGYLDRILVAPLSSTAMAEALRYHAMGRARRQMRSGVQLRAAVAETFARKRPARAR